MQTFEYEYTDTFAGEANYCWVKRGRVSVPDLTAYGYDGRNGYTAASKRQRRVIMRKVKAAVGLTGARGRVEEYGGTIEFRPYRAATVLFVYWVEA